MSLSSTLIERAIKMKSEREGSVGEKKKERRRLHRKKKQKKKKCPSPALGIIYMYVTYSTDSDCSEMLVCCRYDCQ